MNTFIIKNVNIVTEYGLIANGFVYVKRGIIRNVGMTDPVRIHRSCNIIDGRGGLLMPGFIDLYNGQLAQKGDSCFSSIETSLYRHGVTTVFHILPGVNDIVEGKWSQLRKLGVIRHHFLETLPVLNSFYLAGTAAFSRAIPVHGGKRRKSADRIVISPEMSDMLRNSSMYAICSDDTDISLLDCAYAMVQFCSVRLEDAVGMISINPAKALGIEGRQGSIAKGKRADLVLAEYRGFSITVRKVFVNGCLLLETDAEWEQKQQERRLSMV